MERAGIPPFSLYELRHTFATRLSTGGVADHFVTQLLRQGDSAVFKRYSQAKLNMMREALAKLNRGADEQAGNSVTVSIANRSVFSTVLARFAGLAGYIQSARQRELLKQQHLSGGRYWARTSDLLLVRQAL